MVTTAKPYFYFKGKQIFALFDPPHLIKSVRNILLKNDLNTIDGTISWNIIEDLYRMDCKNKARVCPKLTKEHIELKGQSASFKKMRVSLVTQVLSKPVAAGIETLLKLNKFTPSQKACAASKSLFIRKFDKLFDIFNSRNRFH